MTGSVMAAEIEIGKHKTAEFLGMTWNVDTIWSTAVAGLVVVGLGFWMRAKITSGTPNKVQLVWEEFVTWVNAQVEQSLGRIQPFVVPLAVALFAFIFVANLLEIIPTNHWLPSPTADANLTYAMAFFVIVGVHVYGVRQHGFRGYAKHFTSPFPALAPINVIEEIVKPFSLALRLFGNLFASGIMISMIGLFPSWLLWAPNGIWKLFDIFIAIIQAIIFGLLTIIYFGMAGESPHGSDEESAEHAGSATGSQSVESTTNLPQPEGAH